MENEKYDYLSESFKKIENEMKEAKTHGDIEKIKNSSIKRTMSIVGGEALLKLMSNPDKIKKLTVSMVIFSLTGFIFYLYQIIKAIIKIITFIF